MPVSNYLYHDGIIAAAYVIPIRSSTDKGSTKQVHESFGVPIVACWISASPAVVPNHSLIYIDKDTYVLSLTCIYVHERGKNTKVKAKKYNILMYTRAQSKIWRREEGKIDDPKKTYDDPKKT